MHVLNNGSVGFQVQYQLIFCLWVLTFNHNIATLMTKCVFNTRNINFNHIPFYLYFARHALIPRLSEILAETQKEKVTRMIVAFLRVSSTHK